MNPAFALAEVVWILAGCNDSAFLNFWNPILPKYAGDGDTYDGAYGHRLRRQFGIDQLERAYLALKSNPSTRQVVLQMWDATTDLPTEDGAPRSPDVPCNIVSLLKIRERKLHWTQIIRSNDLVLGVPYNFVQFMTIQEIMAGWLEVELGPYVQWSDSLHVYESRLSDLQRAPADRASDNTDNLALPKPAADEALRVIVPLLQSMSREGATPEQVRELVATAELPPAYRNLLCVTGADAARRLDGPEIADQIVEQCSNPALSHLWRCWRSRQSCRP